MTPELRRTDLVCGLPFSVAILLLLQLLTVALSVLSYSIKVKCQGSFRFETI